MDETRGSLPGAFVPSAYPSAAAERIRPPGPCCLGCKSWTDIAPPAKGGKPPCPILPVESSFARGNVKALLAETRVEGGQNATLHWVFQSSLHALTR